MTINDLMARGGALNDVQMQVLKRAKVAKKTNIFTKRSFGRYKTVTPAAGGFTCIVQMELETHHSMVRIGIPNLHTAAISGVKVQVSVANGWVGGHWQLPTTPSGGAWQDVTFNGAASGSLAARLDANNASITYTDLIRLNSIPRTDGGSRPIIAVKIQFPDAAVITAPTNDFYGWRAFTNTGRQMRVTNQSVLGIDTPASYTNTASVDVNTCVPIVEYRGKVSGRQIMLLGDSTVEGTGGSQRAFGAVQRAATEVSTVDNPIEYYNFGLHGLGASSYLVGLTSFQPIVKASAIFATPLSVNDIAVGGMNYLAYNALNSTIKALMEQPGVDITVLGTLPFNAAFRNVGAADVRRREFNEMLATYKSFTYADGYVEAFSGDLDANGQTTIRTGLSSDNVHPNEAGYEVLKHVIKPYVEALL